MPYSETITTFPPLSTHAIADTNLNVSLISRQCSLLEAWCDSNAHSMVEKFLSEGLLQYVPECARLVIDVLEKCAALGDNDESTITKLRATLCHSRLHRQQGASFALDEMKRVHRRVDQLKTLLPHQASSFLDVGCGNGEIATRISRFLGLNAESSFAADVTNRMNSQDQCTYLTVHNNEVPLPDNSIAAATLLMTLHHESSPEILLKEVFRIMQKNGVVIVRDHDASTASQQLAFRAIDTLYFSLFSKDTNVPMPANYQAIEYWKALAEGSGFTIESVSYPEPDSPMNPFHMVLRKR